MSKKRGNGEGSIIKLSDGRYEARIAVKDPCTGKYRTHTRSRKTRKEVQEWLAAIKIAIGTGQYVGNHQMTVANWLDTWLHEYSKPKVRVTTWESYESMVRNHIKPHIGHILLRDLRPEQVQRLYNQKLTTDKLNSLGALSPTTVCYIHAV